MPGHNAGHAPRNKGHVYPADPPTVDEIVAATRQTPADRHGLRPRALTVVLWRGGLRIQEALSLIESDLDPPRGSILIRAGKGNRRREVGMNAWAWSDHLALWLAPRVELPVGPLFCVIDGPTRGRPWSPPRVGSWDALEQGGDYKRDRGVDAPGTRPGLAAPGRDRDGMRRRSLTMAYMRLDHHQRYTFVGISTAWACRSWCGANRRASPASAAVRRSWTRSATGDQGRPRALPEGSH